MENEDTEREEESEVGEEIDRNMTIQAMPDSNKEDRVAENGDAENGDGENETNQISTSSVSSKENDDGSSSAERDETSESHGTQEVEEAHSGEVEEAHSGEVDEAHSGEVDEGHSDEVDDGHSSEVDDGHSGDDEEEEESLDSEEEDSGNEDETEDNESNQEATSVELNNAKNDENDKASDNESGEYDATSSHGSDDITSDNGDSDPEENSHESRSENNIIVPQSSDEQLDDTDEENSVESEHRSTGTRDRGLQDVQTVPLSKFDAKESSSTSSVDESLDENRSAEGSQSSRSMESVDLKSAQESRRTGSRRVDDVTKGERSVSTMGQDVDPPPCMWCCCRMMPDWLVKFTTYVLWLKVLDEEFPDPHKPRN